MHSHCMHIFSTIFYLCLLSLPSLASEFFLFIPSVFTPIYLCSALSSLVSVRIAIFFHGIFPDHEVSGYPSSPLSLYSLANWRLPKLFPVLSALITAFRVLHLEWRRLLLRVSIFTYCCVFQLLRSTNVLLFPPTEHLIPIQLLFLHGPFCSKWFGSNKSYPGLWCDTLVPGFAVYGLLFLAFCSVCVLI